MNYTTPKQNIAIIPSSQPIIQNPPIVVPYVKFQYNMLNLFKTEGCGACGK